MDPREPGRICSHSSSGILVSADIQLKSPLKIDRLASKLCWLHAVLMILLDFYLVQGRTKFGLTNPLNDMQSYQTIR